MKKILILTARQSGGEDGLVANLRARLRHAAAGELQLEVLDLLESCYGRFDSLLGRAFRFSSRGENPVDGSARLRDSLRDLLRRFQPDVVAVTCPLYALMTEQIYGRTRARDFSLIGLAMEAGIEASLWTGTRPDFLAVANERTARELILGGQPEERVRIFEFPLQLPGADSDEMTGRQDLARGGQLRVLYLVNCVRRKAPKLLDRLLEHPEWRITVCAEDAELEEMARSRETGAGGRLRVMGSLQDLPGLLRQHHVVVSRAETGIVQEAIAAGCPLLAPKSSARAEEENLLQLKQANAGALARKPREVVDWLERGFRDQGALLELWRANLGALASSQGAPALAEFVLEQASAALELSAPALRALPRNEPARFVLPSRLPRAEKRVLVCDLHTHTTWSDGKLTVAELVDFYGQRGFDCLCITDHLCDPQRLIGKLVNLTGMVIAPDQVPAYFEAIEREKKRAWSRYGLLLMTGMEFNKDGYTAKTSTHLLGIDLKKPIDPSLNLKEIITEIHAQGALAIASHPHEVKSHWGKDTLYLWEHVEEYAPLLDAWEVANRDDIFNPVGLRKLPYIASSDFHKPKHIHSWKTVLYCEKEAEAIKHCIRVNRDLSMTLYRDHCFGLDDQQTAMRGPESEQVA